MIPLNGFTCCLGAAALYLLSRVTGRDAEILKSVTRVCQLKDLVELFEGESKVLPLMVAVSGRVGSETPIKSELSGLNCVLVEETVEQHFLKRSWGFSWVQCSTLLQPMSKEVPWYLDDETGRVNVAGAQGATGFALTVVSEVFEKSEQPSFVRGLLESLQGLKMLGVKRSEHVLPTGTPLTVVGEAVKDGTGNFRIQKPEIGPFCVSPIPINQIVKLGNLSRKFKYASIVLAVVGVILPVTKYILKRIEDNRTEHIREERNRTERIQEERNRNIQEERRQQQIQRRAINAAAKRAKPATIELERQHKNTSDGTSRGSEVQDLCVICLEEKYNAVFVQCGHMCCCLKCALKFQGKNCPLCRRRITQVLKIYRP